MLRFFLASLAPLVSAPSPEQAAFDYFATVLVAQYYPRKHLYVTGHTEASAHVGGLFGNCFPAITEFPAFWSGHRETAAASVPIAYRGFAAFKPASVFNRRGVQVKLYRAVAGPGGVYVNLKVWRRNHFTDHYLFKISGPAPGGVEVCRQGEIW
jgi:hypothetical protein